MAFRRAPPPLTKVTSAESRNEYGSDIDLDTELPTPNTSALPDNRSDYGSELDTEGEQILSQVLSGLEGTSVKRLVLESIEEDDNKRCVVHLPKYSSQDSESLLSTSIRSSQAEREGDFDSGRETSHSTRKNSSLRRDNKADS